jgi:hypothetical protein
LVFQGVTFYDVVFDDRECSRHAGPYLSDHVDTFPISADKDPWRQSEPSSSKCCKAIGTRDGFHWECTRAPLHAGHHVARIIAGDVCFRWPQETAPKPGPRVGDEVVAAELVYGMGPGHRGSIVSTEPKEGVFAVRFQYDRPGFRFFKNIDFGGKIVPAAEWDARQKAPPAPTGVAGVCGDGGPIHLLSPEPPPAGRFDFLKPFHDNFIIQAQLSGLPQPELMCTAKVTSFARALFELDFAEHAIRVGDEGKGGIGKAAVLARMWERASEDTRSTYEWRAAVVLKRAGELA